VKPSFRCSELDRVLTCHASRILAPRFPNESTGAAHEGNWCHWKSAWTLVQEEGACIGDGGLPETEEAAECGDFKPNGFSEFVVDYLISDVRYETTGMAIMVEDELEADFGDFFLTGHADVTSFTADGKECIGWDLKAGAIPVDPADQNNQMLGYIVLVYLNYPGVEKITWKICQPKNNPDYGMERISEVTIEGRENLDKLVAYLKDQLMSVIKNPFFINSDDNRGSQCKYCPAALKCIAFRHDVNDMKTTLTEEQIASIDGEISIEDLVFFEDARKKFDTPFKKAADMLKEKLSATPGEEAELPDGRIVYLKERNTRRSWHEETMVDLLKKVKSEGLTEEQEALIFDIKFSNFERVIAKVRDIPITSSKKESAKDVVEKEYGPFFNQPVAQIVSFR